MTTSTTQRVRLPDIEHIESDEEEIVENNGNDDDDSLFDESLFASMSLPAAAPLRIGICGEISVGKSSLINALLGLDICEVGALRTTGCVCRFSVNKMIPQNASIDAIDALCRSWSKEIEEQNHKYAELRKQGFSHLQIVNCDAILQGRVQPLLYREQLQILDMPGLNETEMGALKNFDELVKSELFKDLRYLAEKECDIVVIVIDPSKIEHKNTVQIVSAISSVNPNIIICLNKADEIKKKNMKKTFVRSQVSVQEQPTIEELDMALIQEQVKKLQDKFYCPACAVSTYESYKDYLPIKQLALHILAFQLTDAMKLRKEIIREAREHQRVPLNMYNKCTENYANSLKKMLPFASLTGAGMLTLVGLSSTIMLLSGTSSGLASYKLVDLSVKPKKMLKQLAQQAHAENDDAIPQLPLKKKEWMELLLYVSKSVDGGFDKGYWTYMFGNYWNFMPEEYLQDEQYHDFVIVPYEKQYYLVSGMFIRRTLLTVKEMYKLTLV